MRQAIVQNLFFLILLMGCSPPAPDCPINLPGGDTDAARAALEDLWVPDVLEVLEDLSPRLDMPPELLPDLEQEALPDGPGDTLWDVAPDVAPDATPDVAPELVPDVVPDVAPDVAPDVPPPPPVGLPALNEVRCHKDDFVELVNLSEEDPVPLAGYAITDDLWDPNKLWFLPEDLYLPPGGRLVLYRQTPDEVGFTFGLQCGADTIYLLDPDEVVVDAAELPLHSLGNTWGRLPDGAGEWVETAATPEEVNGPALDLGALLFDPFKVNQVDLSLSDVSLASLEVEPYVYVPGEVVFTVDGESSAPFAIGARIKGRAGSLRPLDKKSALKLKMNFSVPGQTFLGLKKFTLNNMVQDDSMLHEALAYTLFREFGIPCPRLGYTWVTINGEDYGLYANIESMDEIFLSRFYPETTHLFEGDYGSDVVPGEAGELEIDEGNPNNISDLLFLIEAAQAEDEAWLDAVAPYVDLLQMTRVWMVEQYIGHWDGYAPTINNYYLHSDGDGLFTMLPWGTDQTFSLHLTINQGLGHLFQRCMGLKPCRDQYTEALSALVAMVPGLDLVPFVEELALFLEPWIEADPRRESTLEEVAVAVAQTIEFLQVREADLAALDLCLSDPAEDLDGDGAQCLWDCDEEDPETWVGAEEICGDGIDQSCSGTADDDDDCPDCVPVYRGPRRYLFCPNPRTFAEAGPHCAEEGSELVIVDDSEENLWVLAQANLFAMTRPWLGLNDIAVEDTWLWADGSEPAYLNWNINEPNDSGGEDCVQLLPSGLWNDIKCAASYPVICEDVCIPGEGDDCL